jgi:hypothetical protein
VKHAPPPARFWAEIGHTGYLSETRVIDVCGVLDPVIARRHVKNFGKGQAGHEKIAEPDYIFKKRPTYVGLRVLHGDLYRRGYILNADIPDQTFEGVWQLDTLPEHGRFLDRRGSTSGARERTDGRRPVSPSPSVRRSEIIRVRASSPARGARSRTAFIRRSARVRRVRCARRRSSFPATSTAIA